MKIYTIAVKILGNTGKSFCPKRAFDHFYKYLLRGFLFQFFYFKLKLFKTFILYEYIELLMLHIIHMFLRALLISKLK